MSGTAKAIDVLGNELVRLQSIADLETQEHAATRGLFRDFTRTADAKVATLRDELSATQKQLHDLRVSTEFFDKLAAEESGKAVSERVDRAYAAGKHDERQAVIRHLEANGFTNITEAIRRGDHLPKREDGQ